MNEQKLSKIKCKLKQWEHDITKLPYKEKFKITMSAIQDVKDKGYLTAENKNIVDFCYDILMFSRINPDNACIKAIVVLYNSENKRALDDLIDIYNIFSMYMYNPILSDDINLKIRLINNRLALYEEELEIFFK